MKRRLVVLLALLVATLAVAAAVYARRPEDPGARHYRRGLQAAREGRPRDAEREWLLAAALNPRLGEPRLELAQAYLDQGAVALAIRELRELAQSHPRLPHVFCRLAEAYHRGNLPDLARATATYSRQAEPRCSRGQYVLGVILLGAQEYGEAQRALEAACRYAPRDAEAHRALARLHLALDRPAEAEATARRALELDAANADASYVVGHCLLLKDPRSEEAVRLLKAALAADPRHTEAQVDLARAYAAAGRHLAARWELEQVLEGEPQNRAALQQLSSVLVELKDERRAAQVRRQVEVAARETQQRMELERKLHQNPTDAATLMTLGGLYERSGEFLRAIEMLERAGEVAGPTPQQQQMLARVRRRSSGVMP